MSTELPEHVHRYRRLWWARVREQLGRTAADFLMAAAGLAGGVWLASVWTTSETVATGVVLGCALGTMLAGRSVWRRIRQARIGPPGRPEWPGLIRLTVRGETAVVVAPYDASESAAATVGVVAGTLLYQELSGLDVGPATVAVSVLLGAALASTISRTLTWLARPGLAMFADRVEIRRGFGRYVIPWSAIAGADVERGRAVVYVQRPDLVTRKGVVFPRYPDAVRAGAFALPATEIFVAIERFRQDATARRAIASVVPRVVDDGTP
jgi:Bacterial PH domain